jgi:mRNA interferase MazF
VCIPFEVLVEPPEGGLTRRSKVLLMQLRAVDKRRVRGRYGTVSDATLRRIEDALKVATGLTRM